MALSSASWRATLEHAAQLEAQAIWLPAAAVDVHGDDLFEIRFDVGKLRQGDLVGSIIAFDEHCEGAHVHHKNRLGQVEWSGTIRIVFGAEGRFTLRLDKGRRPAPNDGVQVFPSVFLQSALDWVTTNSARAANVDHEIATRARDAECPREPTLLARRAGRTLRRAQSHALELGGQPLGVVWGPPGTGKTTTLGALVARRVESGRRVLVVTPTNVAADGACLALYDALEPGSREQSEIVRTALPVLAESFASRPGLSLWSELDKEMLALLVTLRRADAAKRTELLAVARGVASEATRSAVKVRDALQVLQEIWKERRETLVRGARVVVSTVRMAISNGWPADFDEIIVDEASMVSRSDGYLMLLQQAPRGAQRSLLLFGDPMQLGPIPPRKRQAGEDDPDSASDSDTASGDSRVTAPTQYWLGTSILSSILDEYKTTPMVLLDEQSRMNADLCRIVSSSFYDGRLASTSDAPPPGLSPHLPGGICVLDTDAPMPKRLALEHPELPYVQPGGVFSPTAARYTVALVRRLAMQGKSVVVCSPFRAQASLLRRGVGDLEGVRVGTIHKMQGQEADVAVFDPAHPSRWFISKSSSAPRLVNVAASRARSAWVLVGKRSGLAANPWLEPFVDVALDVGDDGKPIKRRELGRS
jgi:hypothetical protein